MKKRYRIKLDFDAAHYLPHYAGPCANLHGHTWHIEFYITVPKKLDESGIGLDFKVLKEKLKAVLPDHQLINDIIEHPTAEIIVEKLYYKAAMEFPMMVEKVILWETEKNGIEFSNS